MAITGKNNIVEMARNLNAPYWKIYESEHKRSSGNFVAIADFENPNLALETSMDKLRNDLNRLTPGRYVFVTTKTNNPTSKNMMDTTVEIEGGSIAAIGAVGAAAEFYMEGIGKVTADNFESAMESKIKKMQDEHERVAEEKRLKSENEDLKKQIAEHEVGFNKGVMTIGTIAYGMMSNTPAGKEFIGMAKQAMFAANKMVPGEVTATADNNEAAVSGTEDDRLATAIEKLGSNNPAWLNQLEKLAALKEKDPSTFEMAVGSLDSL